MLGRLIKYDFKSTFRSLLPLCAAFIVVGALAGLSIPDFDAKTAPPTVIVVLWGTIMFALVALTVAVSIISMIIVITRFYKNLLGSEGYLSFTLPVSAKMHLTSKCISGYVEFAIAFLSGIISYGLFLLIAVARVGNLINFKKVFEELAALIVNVDAPYAVFFILTALAGTFQALIKIYFSMMLGHQSEDHKILMSFVGYIVISIIEATIEHIISIIFLGVSFISETTDVVSLGYLIMTFVITMIFNIVYVIGTYYLMNNKLNLE
ncbi:MAG: hypothetical protein K6E13_01285 [Lachnospiraceae bacterium]|nr:hypothetical protein [Lachnospiraceae bacterium]